jgi:hypothetical protein
MTETAELFKMILTDQWDEDTCRLVGQIAISFAQLEHILWLSPKRVRKLRFPVWEAMAGQVTIPQRCEQIRKTYALKRMHQGLEAELDRLLLRIERANDARNSIIHGRWGCKKNEDRTDIVSRHRIWRGKDRGIDHAQLTKLRDEVRELRDQLGRYSW